MSSIPFAISAASAANTAARAKLDPRFSGLRARLLVMALLYLGPLPAQLRALPLAPARHARRRAALEQKRLRERGLRG
ncbi:MAG: hypothetical protein U1E86_28745 [Burkholderiaceae bacterium]